MKKYLLILFPLLIIFFISSNSFSQHQDNNAASFNGTTSYVDIPDNAELNPTTAITLEAWVYPLANDGCNCIVGKNWNTSYWFGLNCGGGKLRFYPKGFSSQVNGNGVIPLNTWTHVAATYDGTSTKLYINGQLDATSALNNGPLVVNTDPLYIGCDRDGATRQYFWNGYIDNVRIWNVARTETQIRENMHIPLQYRGDTGTYGGLTAAYLLDWSGEDWSGTIYNNGTLQNLNFINYSTKPTNYSDYNNSLYLDGNSHCVAPNSSDFNATTAITVETWIRRDLTPPVNEIQFIISKGSTVSGGRMDYHLKLINNTLAFDIGSGGTVEYANAITDDKWYHVAGTYNSADGTSKLYIDGKKVAEIVTPSKPLINSNEDSLYIGRAGIDNDELARFKGSIDEVRIWKNAARTEEEIRSTMYTTRGITDGASGSCTYAFDQWTNLLRAANSGIETFSSLRFRGNALLNSAKTQNTHSSPIIFAVSQYQQSQFVLSTEKTVINPGSTVYDSVFVPGTSLSVDNLEAVLMINHGSVGALDITLYGPGGFSTKLTPDPNTNYTSNDLIALIIQGADSNLAYNNLQLAPFSPMIKPAGNLWGALGSKADGWWKIKVTDASTGNMLRVINCWGLKIETSTQVQYTVTTSSNPSNYGTTSGGGTYSAGTQVTVSAAPLMGYNFVNWTENSNVVSTNQNYTFTLNADRNLVANFAVTPTLIVAPDFINVPATSGSGTFTVTNTTGGTMNWTASSNALWLTITSGTSGTNDGTISFSYETNTGAARIGTITVTATNALGSPKNVEVRQDVGVSVDDLLSGIPDKYVLAQNYPNPFNPSTIIRYGLPEADYVTISIYDVIGNELVKLVDKYQSAGYHEALFNLNSESTNFPTGVYFYKLVSGNFTQVKKMMILK